jgi:FkbM family methyltransferase
MNNVNEWFRLDGDNTFRVNYDLNENSIVFDVGGYVGSWSKKIYDKYGCNIYIFEPIKQFYNIIYNKYKFNDKIKCYNFGLSHQTRNAYFNVDSDSTSEHIGNNKNELVKIVNIMEFIKNENIKCVDLIKINIEGEEYPMLENISDNFSIFNNIQVQFHDFIPNSKILRNDIIEKLKLTHIQTYCFEYVWENWERIR